MSEATEQVQTDAEALASMMAGYNARGAEPAPPAEEPETSAPEEIAPAEDDVQAEPSVADKLEALKAEVKAMKESGDPDAVRKLHGEIGNINRTIKQMQAPAPAEAPATDDLAEALAAADQMAADFPELGAPMARMLKSIAAKQTHSAPEINIDSVVSSKVQELRMKDAIEALAEEHPDFDTVRETPEFKTWIASKTPEYQTRLTTTWNPAVVAKGLTEFKEAIAVKQKKQARLAAAVTPQGVPQSPGPSTIPDDQGFANGYNRKRLR